MIFPLKIGAWLLVIGAITWVHAAQMAAAYANDQNIVVASCVQQHDTCD